MFRPSPLGSCFSSASTGTSNTQVPTVLFWIICTNIRLYWVDTEVMAVLPLPVRVHHSYLWGTRTYKSAKSSADGDNLGRRENGKCNSFRHYEALPSTASLLLITVDKLTFIYLLTAAADIPPLLTTVSQGSSYDWYLNKDFLHPQSKQASLYSLRSYPQEFTHTCFSLHSWAPGGWHPPWLAWCKRKQLHLGFSTNCNIDKHSVSYIILHLLCTLATRTIRIPTIPQICLPY